SSGVIVLRLLVTAVRDGPYLDAPAEILAQVRGGVQRRDADRVVAVARLDHEKAPDDVARRDERPGDDDWFAIAWADRGHIPFEGLDRAHGARPAKLLVVALALIDQRRELVLRKLRNLLLISVEQTQVFHLGTPRSRSRHHGGITP